MISNETVTLEKVLSEFKKISNQYCKCQFKYVKKIQNKNVHFIHLPFGKNL